jgi:signal transduction histidine kinase
MKLPAIGFDQILHSTLSMARRSLKSDLCVFLQFDDGEQLCVRAADGVGAKAWDGRTFPVTPGAVSRCLANKRLERVSKPSSEGLLALLKRGPKAKKNIYILVPVSGQSRTLGILLCGPFSPSASKAIAEDQLRSTGALCAVLTAHRRLYEWLSSFTPQVNHELRTPLTAVQGSIGMVLGGMCGQVGGEMREMLEMAQKGCERTVLAIEEYLTKQLPNKGSELKR